MPYPRKLKEDLLKTSPAVSNQFDDADEISPKATMAAAVRLLSFMPQQHLVPTSLPFLPAQSHNFSRFDNLSVVSSDSLNSHLLAAIKQHQLSCAPPQMSVTFDVGSVSDGSSDEESDDMSSAGSTSKTYFAAPPGVLHDDVLCGRGKGVNNYIGNERFRDLVMSYRGIYSDNIKRKGKRSICLTIVDTIHARGGRFLVKDKESGEWVPLERPKILVKVSQALREGAKKWNQATRKFNTRHAGQPETTVQIMPSSAPAMAMLADVAQVSQMVLGPEL